MANVLVKDFTAKTTPVDADVTLIIDSEASNDNKKITFGNIYNYVKGKADLIYQATLVSGTNIKTVGGVSILGSGDVTVGSGTVTDVSSANADIGVATGTTTPVLTLNSDTAATASKIVKRDSSANVYVNNHFANLTSTVSAGGTTVLTIASSRTQRLTGSSTQTYQLPDATTLPIASIFDFDNNSSSSLIITNAGAATQYTVPAGGHVTAECVANGTANGSWDFHALTPASVTWGSGVTGLVMNSVLTTSPSLGSGASSSSAPSFIPQRGASTTGFGGDGTNLYATIAGSPVVTVSSNTLTVAASGNLAFGAVTVIDDNAGTTTLQNIDAIDATTEATIETAIDTLANLTSIQGRTVTLADAGADAILGWDDSASAYENLTQAEVLAVVGDAAADGTTKGVATFTATDFNATTGNISIDYTNGQKASTTQAGFLTEIAIDTEVTTGTDATRAVSPDALAGSTIFGRKAISIQVTDGTTDVATGDGKAYFTIPESLNGMNLVRAQATVVTAGTTGATTIMIHNKTDTADMLSGAISIASAGTVGTVGTVNGATDDVVTNDVIRIDVDSVSTTAPKGLVVVLEFQLP